MSDKLIRDELLRSHRYVSVSNDTAKLLFLHLTLASDSLSNAEATTTALSIIMGRAISETAAAALLTELADHDLVRLYEDGGKRYVHIPRSRQRIRYLSGKHPRPPDTVEDNEIKELIKKVGLQSDRGQTQVRPFTPEVLLPLPLPLSLSQTKTSKTEAKPARKRASVCIPDPFEASEATKAWAIANGFGSLDGYIEIFVGRHSANGKTYADWQRAFQNCVREDWYELRSKNGRKSGAFESKIAEQERVLGALTGGIGKGRTIKPSD